MKHSFLFILFLTLLFPKAQSQGFHAGIIGGATMTDVSGVDMTDSDNDFHKLGFSLGGLVNHKIGKSSLIQMEIAYIQKGSSQPPDSTVSNNYYRLALNYIDVSLLYKHIIKFNFRKKPVDKFGFEAGLTAGTLFKSSYSFKSVDNSPIVNKLDLELLAGLFYNFTPGFYMSFRYSNSIIHAIPHQSKDTPFNPLLTIQNGNNLVYQITFGFVINNEKNDN